MFGLEILKFAVPAIVAILGWFVAHQFNVYRDRNNKLHDLRTQFLINAYRRLESAANREYKTESQLLDFESAVADIQLLGSKEQVAATVKYLQQHASGENAKIDAVLRLLRKDLRRQLNLHAIPEDGLIFRFTRKPQQ